MPTPVTPDNILCIECYLLLQERILSNITGSHEDMSPAYGHLNICYGCGISIASRRTHRVELDCPQRSMILRWTLAHLVPHLQRVCIPCWLAATRETRRLEVQDSNRPDSVMDAASPSLEDTGIPEPPPMPAPTPQPQQGQDSSSRNEIKVFCPKCNTEVSHTAEGIQEDQTKILVAKVYHYFEQEYEELKKMYGDLDLTPLSKLRQRTAMATGVSETTLLQILKEEEGRNADKRREPPQKRRAARKRRRQTNSSSEEDSPDNHDEEIEQPSNVEEVQTLVVKMESPEYTTEEPEIFIPTELNLNPGDGEISKEDPISVDLKTEPRDDDTANETPTLNEPAATKRRGKKISKKPDDTSTQQHTPGVYSAPVASTSVPLTGTLNESGLPGEREIKMEETEIDEEGFS